MSSVSGFSRPILLAALCLIEARAHATTYYVDSVLGNDANPGTSTSTPWKTASRINSATLAPGDSVLFRRGQSFEGSIDTSAQGEPGEPISLSGWGTGTRPVLFGATVRGDHMVLSELVIDHRQVDTDALRIRGGNHCTLRNLVVRNGTKDGIDADGANGLTVEDVEIHHFLGGSATAPVDAHGLALSSSTKVTLRRVNIHHVSGDSLQTDPNRVPGAISNDVLIEDSTLWTGPLEAEFNAGWTVGDVPGENAIDTKVLTSGYDDEPRMNISLTNVTAYGWIRSQAVPNRAAFNFKEKIAAVLDRITVYDSEIAFRIRGGLGNANVVISNAVVRDVERAFRTEDGLTHLTVYNTTLGVGVGQVLHQAGDSSGTDTWDWRNNAFIGAKPAVVSHASNLVATPFDFVSTNDGDYHLTAASTLIDRGVQLQGVVTDRDGRPRLGIPDVGAFERANAASSVPAAPARLEVSP